MATTTPPPTPTQPAESTTTQLPSGTQPVTSTQPPSTTQPGETLPAESSMEGTCDDNITEVLVTISQDFPIVTKFEVEFLQGDAVIGTAIDDGETILLPEIVNRAVIPTPDGLGPWDSCRILNVEEYPFELGFTTSHRDLELAMLSCADELESNMTAALLGSGELSFPSCDETNNMLRLEDDPDAEAIRDHVELLEGSIQVRSVVGGAEPSAEQQMIDSRLLQTVSATAEMLTEFATGEAAPRD